MVERASNAALGSRLSSCWMCLPALCAVSADENFQLKHLGEGVLRYASQFDGMQPVCCPIPAC